MTSVYYDVYTVVCKCKFNNNKRHNSVVEAKNLRMCVAH